MILRSSFRTFLNGVFSRCRITTSARYARLITAAICFLDTKGKVYLYRYKTTHKSTIDRAVT